MNSAFKKIVAILEKQQVAIKKLAQQENVEENKSYLKSAWQTAGLNSGITQMSTPRVTYQAGADVSLSGEISTTPDRYIISGFIPVKFREKFNKTFFDQVRAQKPELGDKITTIYEDSENV